MSEVIESIVTNCTMSGYLPDHLVLDLLFLYFQHPILQLLQFLIIRDLLGGVPEEYFQVLEVIPVVGIGSETLYGPDRRELRLE